MTRHPPGFRGLLLALATLTAAVGLAVVVGVLLFWLVRVWVDLPNYIFCCSPPGWALLPMLALFRRRFPFLSDWYYLLPATLFLLAFTVYPIVLTMALGIHQLLRQELRAARSRHRDRRDVRCARHPALPLRSEPGAPVRRQLRGRPAGGVPGQRPGAADGDGRRADDAHPEPRSGVRSLDAGRPALRREDQQLPLHRLQELHVHPVQRRHLAVAGVPLERWRSPPPACSSRP